MMWIWLLGHFYEIIIGLMVLDIAIFLIAFRDDIKNFVRSKKNKGEKTYEENENE